MSGINWNNPNKGNYSQDNNGVENLCTKILNNLTELRHYNLYRESCGGTSAVNVADDIGLNVDFGPIQPEDYVMMILNDPRLIKQGKVPGNRYIENYPKLFKILWPEADVELIWFQRWDEPTQQMVNLYTDAQKAQMIQDTLSLPNTGAIIHVEGHYIAGQHYENGKIYYADSWVDNPYMAISKTVKRSMSLEGFAKHTRVGMVRVTA